MSLTRMIAHAFILSELFPLDGFRCNFVSVPYLEYTLVYYHDTLQLCRTGYGGVSRLRIITLAFILFELFPLDGFRCIFCPLHNLNTLWYIIMVLYSYVE